MTSPTEPPKQSFRDRISTRLATDKDGRLIDGEAQHTRNVNYMFYALIVIVIVVIVGALVYGYWESNLKPAATVDGTNISRSELADRDKLQTFRADRFSSRASAALADGTIDADLANTRYSYADSLRPQSKTGTATQLVELTFKEQLAAEEGVELTSEELEAAITADGTATESRFIEAIFVLTTEQEEGLAATDVGIADARARALLIAEGIEAGGDYDELAETHGPASVDTAWITEDAAIGSPAWSQAIFATGAGEVAEVIQGSGGEQLVGHVVEILPEEPDSGFIEAVNDEVGEGVHRRAVELETLADKLEQHVTDEALAAEYEQVLLGEIFIARNPVSADDTAGEARASHIIYQPETPLDDEGVATEIAALDPEDPAWDAAEAEAQAAFEELSAIEDTDERTTAFAERAEAESDDGSASNGGDLGWFPQTGVMVEEFTEPIWANVDAQAGDVLGPVRTDFGWHVLMFHEFRSSLDARVNEAQKALAAEGAEFDTVASEYSEDPDAAQGPVSDWSLLSQLDPGLELELAITDIGSTTQPVDEGDGYYIYQKQDEKTGPLEGDDAVTIAQSAFFDWYDEPYFVAQNDGTISIDASLDE